MPHRLQALVTRTGTGPKFALFIDLIESLTQRNVRLGLGAFDEPVPNETQWCEWRNTDTMLHMNIGPEIETHLWKSCAQIPPWGFCCICCCPAYGAGCCPWTGATWSSCDDPPENAPVKAWPTWFQIRELSVRPIGTSTYGVTNSWTDGYTSSRCCHLCHESWPLTHGRLSHCSWSRGHRDRCSWGLNGCSRGSTTDRWCGPPTPGWGGWWSPTTCHVISRYIYFLHLDYNRILLPKPCLPDLFNKRIDTWINRPMSTWCLLNKVAKCSPVGMAMSWLLRMVCWPMIRNGKLSKTWPFFSYRLQSHFYSGFSRFQIFLLWS